MSATDIETILTAALRLGIIDTFTVIAYHLNGVTTDQITDLARQVVAKGRELGATF